MFVSKIKAIVLSTVLAMAAGGAQAEVITFNDSTVANHTSLTSYTENGYAFTLTSGSAYLTDANVGGATASSTFSYNGTDFLILSGSVTMSNAARTPFSVSSIDLGNFYYAYPSTAMLTGTRADGTTVSQSFTSSITNQSSTTDFTTRALTNFTNLTAFNIQQTSGVYYASVDNINVSAVPEPSTWGMLGLGLMLVAGALRRKKSA